MKKLAFILVALFVLAPKFSLAMPNLTTVEGNLNRSATAGPVSLLGYQVVSNKVQMLKCTYDYAVQGGSSASAINLRAPDNTNCSLPAKAIVIEGMIDVITNPGSAGSATIAVGTGNAANDLKTATAKASFTSLLDVVPVGTAATAIKITTAKSPTMTIATAGLTSGKFNVFIQYLLSN